MGRASVKPTSVDLTPLEALEILQAAILRVAESGIAVAWGERDGSFYIRLEGVFRCPTCRILRPRALKAGEKCRVCLTFRKEANHRNLEG